MFARQIQHLLQFFHGRRPSGRIGRRIDHDGAGFGRNGIGNPVHVQCPDMIIAARHEAHRHIDGTRARQARRTAEIRPGRCRNDHLVVGAHHHPQSQLDGVHAADGDMEPLHRDGAAIQARHIG